MESTRLPALISQYDCIPDSHQHIQKSWDNFFVLIRSLSKSECDADDFEKHSKKWVQRFTSVYQSKTSMHSHNMDTNSYDCTETLLSSVNRVSKKLNDLTMKHYQRTTNHQGYQQVLEKRNRIKLLEDDGYQKSKQVQTCSVCRQPGHSKRSCTFRTPLYAITDNGCEVQTTEKCTPSQS